MSAKKNLREWMKKNRFSQVTLSHALGLSSSATVHEWLNNGRKPHPKTMEKFDELIKEVDKKPFKAKLFFE